MLIECVHGRENINRQPDEIVKAKILHSSFFTSTQANTLAHPQTHYATWSTHIEQSAYVSIPLKRIK